MRREKNTGLEWRDAEEDFLGHVHRVGTGRGHGAAVVVGFGGYDSDWDCELVVCVSDGLVRLDIWPRSESRTSYSTRARSWLSYDGPSMLRPYKSASRTTPRAESMFNARLETW